MSELTRLLLIRHAEPTEDARDRCYGRLDIELSVCGQHCAQEIAHTLDRIEIGAVYTSPSKRARATAAPLAARHHLEAIVDDDLHEIDFGEFEGRSYDEISTAYPELYRLWMETPSWVRFPGGESFAQLQLRALRTMEALRRRHIGTTAAIVSHGGVLRAMLADCLAMPPEAIFRLEQSYGGLSVIDWIDEAPLVQVINAAPTMVAVLPAFADHALDAEL